MNRKDGKGCIYFIGDGSGCVKIGKSNDLAQYRLYALQTGNPRKLEVLKSITAAKSDLSKFESVFHMLFEEYRIVNNIVSEWFTDSDVILEYVKRLTSVDVNVMIRNYGNPNSHSIKHEWLEYCKRKNKSRGEYEEE